MEGKVIHYTDERAITKTLEKLDSLTIFLLTDREPIKAACFYLVCSPDVLKRVMTVYAKFRKHRKSKTTNTKL